MRHSKRTNAFFGLLAAVAGAVFGTAGASTAMAANGYDPVVVPNDVNRGSVVVYKYDAETELSAPQGGATLAGAEFTITNKSDKPIVYHDEYGHTKVYNVDESWTITTKWDRDLGAYVAQTPKQALPQGTYHIKETKSSPGYALATDETYLNRPYIPGYLSAVERKWVTDGYDFKITAQGQEVTFINKDTEVKNSDDSGANYNAGPGAYNPLVRAGIETVKRDHDLKAGIPQGDSKLRDGIWVIYNWNPYPVRVWDHFDQDSNGVLHGIVAQNYSESSRFSSAPEDYADAAEGDSGNDAPQWAASWSTEMEDSVSATIGEPAYDGDTGYTKNVTYEGGGWVPSKGVVAVIRSGDDGRAHTFMDALPVGYYKVVEVEAPVGYSNSELWQSFPSIQEHNWDELVATDADDPVARGAASFRKVDGDVRVQAGTAQGNMKMSGAHISIYNDSEREVVIRDAATYNTGDVSGISGRIAPGQKVAEVVTDETGWATIKGLPYGTYYAIETTAPEGYEINSDWKFHFSIRDTELGKMTSDGNNVVVKTEDKITETGLTGDTQANMTTGVGGSPLSNYADLKNELEISKLDKETNTNLSMVTGDMLVAKFRIQNKSGQPIFWKAGMTEDTPREELIEFADGAYLTDAEGHDYFTTDSFSGKVVLKCLPNCKLEITEYEAPLGYQLNTKVETVNLTGVAPVSSKIQFANQVIREDLQFQKINSKDNKPLAKCAFLLEKYSLDENGNVRYDDNNNPVVIESHILVTDEDGMLDTSSKQVGYQGWRLRTAENVNLSDAAYDGSTVDESKLKFETSYWFYGSTDGAQAPVSSELCALPYGIYHLTELRCEANKGMDLMDRDIYINRSANLIENIGTISNNPHTPNPCCDTSARGTEAKVELDADPANGSTVNGEQIITYTVKYENTTADPIPYLQIRDRIPGSTTYVVDSASNDGVYVEDGNYVEWVIQNVAPGESGTVTFQVKVDKNATSPLITNQARHGVWSTEVVAGDPDNVNPYGSSNVVQHSTDGSATSSRLYAEKSSSVAANEKVVVGDTITYTVKVTNTGSEDLTNIGVSDNVPVNTHVEILNGPETEYQDKANISDGGRFLNDNTIVWDIPRLKAGQSTEVSFTVVVDETAGERIRNQATYGFTMGHCNGEMDNVTNVVTNAVKTDPELTVTKSSSAHDGVAPGEIITYTLHVQNDGRGNAVSVPLYDVIPEGTQYVMGSASGKFTADENHVYPFSEVSSADAGEEITYVSWLIPVIYNRGGAIDVTYQVRVKDNAAIGTTIANRATVGGEDGPLPVTTDNPTSTDDVKVPAVSNLVEDVVINPLEGVTVTKTADPESGSNVAPGDIITYTIEWKNDENGHPVQGFGIRDAIPEHTTFVEGSIELVGADGVSSKEIAAQHQAAIDAGDDCGEIYNPTPDSVVWTPRAAINRSDPEGIYRALMGGDESTHHLRIGWGTLKSRLERLEVGESVEFEVAVDNDYDQLWRATYREDGAIILCMHLIVPSADDSPNYATANGGRANYDQKWKDVWAIIDELKPGETGKLTFQVRVDEDVEANTDITNVATYGSNVFSAPCFDLPNKTNSTVHTVGEPHLVGTKTADPADYARVGDTIHYTVEVTNDGTARAHDVALFDRFRTAGALDGCVYVPGSWKVSGGDAAQTSASFGPSFVTSSEYVYAKSNTLEPGDTIKMEFDVVIASAKVGDKITNVASFEDKHTALISTSDLKESTNGTSIEIDEPNLRVAKSVDVGAGTQIKVGDTIEYTITVTNDAHVAGSGYGIYDAIPENTVYVAGSASHGLNTVTVTEPDPDAEPVAAEDGTMVQPTRERVTAVAAKDISLAAGESKEFSFKVTVDPMLLEDTIINNSATAGVVDELPEQPLEFRSETISNEAIAPKVAIRVAETSDPEPGSTLNSGDVVTYTVEVFNESVKPAKDVCVFTYIPTNMTFVEGSATGGLTLTTDTQTGKPALVATGIELDANGTKTFTFQAKANQTWSDLTAVSHATAGIFEGTPKAELEVDSGEVLHNIVAVKPVLSVVAASDPEAGTNVVPGDEITYVVRLSETAGAPVDNGCVFAYLPDGVELVEDGLAGGLEPVTDEAGNVVAVRASGISLDPFGRTTLAFKVRVLDTDKDTEISETITAGLSNSVPTTTLPIAANVIQHTVIAPKAEIVLTKSATPDSGETVMPGSTITYTLTMKNIGEGNASGLAIFDAIPNNTHIVGGSESGLTAGDGFVYADNIELAAGESKSFAFSVMVDSNILAEGLGVHNEATWGYATAPTERLANVSNAIDHNIIVPKPVITVVDDATPSDGESVVAGDTITYTFTVAETAGVPARNVSVFAFVPANTTLVDAGGLNTIDVDGKPAVALEGINLAAGGSKTYSVSVTADTVSEDTGITFRPSAGIGEPAVAPLSVDGAEIRHTIVAPKVDLRIALASTPESGSTIESGDIIDYAVTVKNDSDAVARDAAVYVAVPENTTYVDMSATGGLKPVTDESGNVIALVADKLMLGAGATKTFRFAAASDLRSEDFQVTAQATCGFGSATEPFSSNVSNTVQHAVHVPKPELSITQSANPADGTEVKAGDEITYTIKVREVAGVNASGVAVFDAIPAGTEFVSASDNLKTITDESGKVTAVYADGIDLVGRGLAAFNFTVKVTNISDDLTIKNDASCGFADAPTASLPIAANQVSHGAKAAHAALSVTQSANPQSGSSVKVGDTIEYTVRVDETAGVNASGVAMFDYIPAGTTLVEDSLTGGLRTLRDTNGRAVAVVVDDMDIPARGSVMHTFKVTVDDTDADTTISNEATVGFASSPERPLEIASQQMLHNVVVTKPVLSIDKTSNPASGSVVKPGDTIMYTIKVSETAGAKASGVAIFDEIPAGVTVDSTSVTGDMRLITDAAGKPAIVVDNINLAAKGEKTYSFKVTVDETDKDIEISNRATTGFATDPVKALPTASTQVTHLVGTVKPVLSVDMTSDPTSGTSVSAGDKITYTIKVSEIAGAKASGVAIYAKAPNGVTIDASKLPEGLSLKDGALVADNITLDAKGTKSFTFEATVNDVTEDTGISTRATAGFATAPTSDLPFTSASVDHMALAPRPELSVEFSVNPSGDVAPGDSLVYTAKVTETAGAPANGAAVFVELPAGVTVNTDNLPEGATVVNNDDGSLKGVAITGINIDAKGTKSFDIPVTVNASESDSVLNARATAGIADEVTGPLGVDSQDVQTNVVAGKPHLVIEKTSEPASGVPVNVDGIIEYTVTVSNDGDGAAHGVAVYDAVPANTQYVDNSASGFAPIEEDGKVVALGASGVEIGVGESKTFSFAVKVDFGIDDDTIIANRATCGFAETAQPNLGTDSNEVSTTVIIPDVHVTVSTDPKDGATVYEGDDINLDINVKNNTSAHDKDVAIFVPVPAGTTYDEGSIILPDGATATTVTDADGNIVGIGIHFDEVAGNANENIRITLTVDGSRVTDISGNVTVGHSDAAPSEPLAEEAGSYSMTVDRVPHLSIVKRQDPGSGAMVAGGDILTYSITVTNTGKSVAHKVGIYDEAPEHTKFVANSLVTDRGDVYVGEDGLLTVIAGDLTPGESATMTFKVKIDYGFTGAIYNRAMWVSPAADPGTAGDVDLDEAMNNANNTDGSDEGVVAPTGVALVGPLAATVPIPDGSYSGVSNEVSAGDGSQTGSDDSGSDTTMVAVPDVVGKTEDAARKAIKDAGLKVSVTTENSDTVDEGKVISQDKTGNVALGTTVSIVVSEGKAATSPSSGNNSSSDSGSNSGSSTPSTPGGSNETSADVQATEVNVSLTASPKGGSEVKIGQVINYTLKIKNPTKVNANDLYVPVELKGDIKVNASSVVATGIAADVVDGKLVAHGTLKPGTGATVTFKAVVGDNAVDSVSAQATVGQSEYPAKPSSTFAKSERVIHEVSNERLNGSSNETSAHVGSTLVQVIKTSDPADGSIVLPGQTIAYTVKVANVGSVNANDLYVSDVLADGLTLNESSLQCDKLSVSANGKNIVAVGTLAPEEVATITFSAKVDDNFVGDIINNVKWGQAEPGTVPEEMSGESNEVMVHVGTTEVSLIKSASIADGEYAAYGDVIDYKIVAKNEGTLKEGADVTITDNVPDGLEIVASSVKGGHVDGNKVVFDSVHLGKDESAEVSFSAKVVAKDGDVSNVAVAKVSTQEEDVTSNSHLVHVAIPALSVTKLSNPESGSFVSGGQDLKYAIVISNTGKVGGAVSFEDVLPGDISYKGDSVKAVIYKMPADAKTAEEIVASANGGSEISASDSPNNFFAWLGDAFLNLFGAGTASDAIHYDSGKVSGTIDIPAGYCALVTYEATVNDGVAAGTEIKNNVKIFADGTEEEHSETLLTVGQADVSMEKSAKITKAETGDSVDSDGAVQRVEAGDKITYTMSLKNNGVAPASDAVMTDTIPDGTSYVDGTATYDGQAVDLTKVDGKDGFSISVGELAAGASSGVLSFQVVVNEDAAEVISNTGHYNVDGKTGDSDKVDLNYSRATFDVKKIGVDEKGNEVKSFKAGSEVRWKITVKNTSSEIADIIITDKPGSGLSFVGSEYVTDENGKAVRADAVGQSSSSSRADKLLSEAQTEARSRYSAASKTFGVGLGSNKGVYYGGSALVAMIDTSDANFSAMPVPRGNYEVTCDAEHTANIKIYKADNSGSVSDTVASDVTLAAGETKSVDVPTDCRMNLTIKKTNGDVADTTEYPLAFKQISGDAIATSNQKSSSEYVSGFIVEGVAPGETRSFIVRTRAAANMNGSATNTVTVYNADNAKVLGSATATLTKGAADGKNGSSSSGSLPKTAASLMALGAVAAGAAFVAFGGVELVRSRAKKQK